MYPIIFESVYKEMIWGGVKLRDTYSRNTPFLRTGESWDITCRENEMGIVKNGAYKDMSFLSVIRQNPEKIMGERYKNFDRFPLLVKLIDANDYLSVQVHPDDAYARKAENYPQGKNEMWYILSAEPESFLYIGLKDGVTKETFKSAIHSGKTENCLNKLYVSPGDCVDVPAGLVHAIGKGIVLAEIQQNSDITYRVYDYERTGLDGKSRELHIEKSMDVIDFSGRLPKTPVKPKLISTAKNTNIYEYIKNPYFTALLYDIKDDCDDRTDKETFHILTCVKGGAEIKCSNGALKITEGDSIFIPAALGEYEISGQCLVIKSS
jgi:mannose-6-phosphate isomerase